jgi:CRISPR-associated protein Cmx8
MTAPAKKTRPATAKTKGAVEKSPSSELLELEYSLAELPSAQHRAGLAGLVMMVRWLERAPGAKTGTCSFTRLDEAGATLTVDREGLRRLFDETYAADKEEVPKKQLWKNKDKEIVPPIRTEEIEVPDGKGKGKVKKEKVYYYEVVVPKAGLLVDREPPTTDGKTAWVKLWRDMLWETLRGVPATRAPFEERAEKSSSADWETAFVELGGNSERSVDLPSTYYIGAQATTAEDVPFKDRVRQRFLLHFWPYAAQIYVPRVMNASDGKSEFVGYAIAVPDVAELETFCEELPRALAGRGTGMLAYRPLEALIDHPAESALDLACRLRERISAAEGARRTTDLVLGFEVFHLKKEGNSVRVLSVARVEPEDQMVDEYLKLKRMGLWDLGFRRQRLLNLLDGRRWYEGFDRLIATSAQDKLTIGSPAFCHDARISFQIEKQQKEASMSEGESQPDEAVTLESVLYALMWSYAIQKTETRLKTKWEEVKDKPREREEFNEKRRKIAKDAFLSVRSRTADADFVAYFAGTLCSVHQSLSKERYALISDALRKKAPEVRTLTLLALSAVS